MCKDPIKVCLVGLNAITFSRGTRNIISLPELQPAVNSQPVLYEKRNFALSWISFCNTSYLVWVSVFICVFAGVFVFVVLQICEWTALQPVYDEEHNVALSWQFAVGACWHAGRLAEELNWFASPLSPWPWFAFCGKREIRKIRCCDRVMYWIVRDKNCLGQGAPGTIGIGKISLKNSPLSVFKLPTNRRFCYTLDV